MQVEYGIGPLQTQSRRNWVLKQYTLMQVYTYYISDKGELLKLSSFYMLMTYSSWVKTSTRLKM